ncbi:MAG: FtsH protease activity modulator HflK [Armatimonadetes bacterium]|nr:FtsH protease activity modulator HflK [Armatimonadota bacterium]
MNGSPEASGQAAQWRHAWWAKRAAAALAVLYLLSGAHAVRPGERVVVRRFGRALTPHGPGLHFALPWPIDRRTRLRTEEPRRATVGFGAVDPSVGASLDPRRSRFLTGDENVVQVQMVVQYTVQEPIAFAFEAADARRMVEVCAQRALAETLARTPVDDVLTQAKSAVCESVRRKTQYSLNTLKLGISVVSVSIPAAEPPAEVAADFQDVASAKVDYRRIIDEGEAYAAETVPRARGEASRLQAEAEGYRAKVTNEARGDAAYFRRLRAEHARAPGVTASRLYLESMERLLPKMRVIVADESGNRPLDLAVVQEQP